MTQDGVNKGRRTLLLAATGAVSAVGAGFAATPFVQSWAPSEKAKAIGAPTKVDIASLEVGGSLTVEWRGKPIFILRRPASAVETLKSAELKQRLKDPESSNAAQQPENMMADTRSLGEELLVIEGVCTHLGCSPKIVPEVVAQPYDADWQGGFYCPCHGSTFDLAGRVFNGSPAADNLKVPPHKLDGTLLTIGEVA